MTELLGSLAMLLLASLWVSLTAGEPLWSLDPAAQKIAAAFASAYLASSILLRARDTRGFLPSLVDAVVCSVACVGSAVIVLELRNYELSKQVIVNAISAGLFLSMLSTLLQSRRGPLQILLVLTIAGGISWNFAVASGAFKTPEPGFRRSFISSQLFGINATYYPLPSLIKPGGGIPLPVRGMQLKPGGGIREGGGIISLPKGYLLVSGAGDFYLFDKPTNGARLLPKELDIRVPINGEAFKRAVGGDTAVRYWNFRVQDVQVQIQPNGMRVFVSHHHWSSEGECYVVQVSSFELSGVDLLAVEGQVEWETIFRSEPCLKIKVFSRGQRFAGEESGGKLALLSDQTLLLTLGDHEFDGLNSDHMLAQDPKASYGKIIAIEIPSWHASVYSTGHRNPQGLFVGSDQVVWSTEHGPAGGDELNRITQGKNYGWPVATYGVDYGLTEWPMNAAPGSHAGYEVPIYAWIPSIGVSNLAGVEKTRFEAWRGDLLVTSLRDRGLWRMRIRNGGLVVNERIEIGVRMRDIIEGKQGEIVLWSDENPQIVFLEPAGDYRPPEAVIAVCGACHSMGSTGSAVGPNLKDVFGREIASYSDYKYSKGLSEKTGSWDEAELDAFLADPQGFAPGTSMALPGIESAAERKVVIDFLKAL